MIGHRFHDGREGLRRTAVWPWSEAVSWEWVAVDHRQRTGEEPPGGLRGEFWLSHLDRGDPVPPSGNANSGALRSLEAGLQSEPGSLSMGSFKANGREQGPNRRRNTKSSKRRGFLRLECLEERQLLSTAWVPTSTNLADAQQRPDGERGVAAHQRLRGVQAERGRRGRPGSQASPSSSSRTTRCSWA